MAIAGEEPELEIPMSGALSFPLAFAAGLASFLSPCVLPLVPAYLSFMTGLTISELAEQDRSLSRVLVPALLFVAGFSVVFVGLGASASVLGEFLVRYRFIVERIAGLLVIAFGILMLGVIKVPWLYGEARADMSRARSLNKGASFVMGMAFAAGWTPCVGPILGSILLVAGKSQSVLQGTLLLLVYSIGLGVPFIGVALLFGSVRPVLVWMNKYSLILSRVAGAVLIAVGLLLLVFGDVDVVHDYQEAKAVAPLWYESVSNWLRSIFSRPGTAAPGMAP
jgi:cytochrome c-type biogenesis protein